MIASFRAEQASRLNAVYCDGCMSAGRPDCSSSRDSTGHRAADYSTRRVVSPTTGSPSMPPQILSYYLLTPLMLVALQHLHDHCLVLASALQGDAACARRAVSWLLALFEYCLAVPANRYGSAVYSAAQLKTIQEVITLLVFAVFSVVYLKQPLAWNTLIGFALIGCGAYFVFRGAGCMTRQVEPVRRYDHAPIQNVSARSDAMPVSTLADRALFDRRGLSTLRPIAALRLQGDIAAQHEDEHERNGRRPGPSRRQPRRLVDRCGMRHAERDHRGNEHGRQSERHRGHQFKRQRTRPAPPLRAGIGMPEPNVFAQSACPCTGSNRKANQYCSEIRVRCRQAWVGTAAERVTNGGDLVAQVNAQVNGSLRRDDVPRATSPSARAPADRRRARARRGQRESR